MCHAPAPLVGSFHVPLKFYCLQDKVARVGQESTAPAKISAPSGNGFHCRQDMAQQVCRVRNTAVLPAGICSRPVALVSNSFPEPLCISEVCALFVFMNTKSESARKASQLSSPTAFCTLLKFEDPARVEYCDDSHPLLPFDACTRALLGQETHLLLCHDGTPVTPLLPCHDGTPLILQLRWSKRTS